MPEDITPLTQLIAQLDQRVFASVVFTSQIQARHLFQVAGDDEAQAALADSLNHKTVTASIGPTCSAALRSLGVNPHVEPEHPKMGPLVSALARHLVSDKFYKALIESSTRSVGVNLARRFNAGNKCRAVFVA
jgi:uroporphyrinogen-III synthase